MKKIFSTILALMILAASATCLAESNGAMRLGILPVFKASSVSANLRPEDLEIATSAIYAGMAGCPDFEILSRTDVDKLVQEQELASFGLVDSSTAPAFGKMLGAEYLLIANVTGLNSTKKPPSTFSKNKNDYIVTAKMSARIVEVETGRVVLAVTSTATSNVKVTSSLVRVNSSNPDKELTNEVLEKSAEDLVKKLLANLEQKKKKR